MKYGSKLFLLLALTALLGWGCQSMAPTGALGGSSANSSNLVINFEGTPATVVNPFLAEAGVPGNVVQSPGNISVDVAGGVTFDGIVSPGANGTAHAYQVSGPVTGSICQMIITLDTKSTSGYYNASLFKGVQFYMRVMTDDNCTSRQFSIPIAQTMPVTNGGTCLSGCYDHFGYTYQGTGGKWQLYALNFSSLTRNSYGSAVNPPTLTGSNLAQFVQLQWQENGGGSSNADFGIDEVQFY
jgi:hypothetical protein